jgi:glycosyltransferase involved in cell wall biosynthesis
VRFVPLPHYPTVRHFRALARARAGAVAAFRRELPGLDVAWLFGPHPLSVSMSRAARRASVPVVLGVRQDLPQYIRGRLPSRGWHAVMPAVHALELAYRRLARRVPAVVVGEDVAARYRGGGAPVLAIVVSLITDADIVDADAARAKSWDGPRVVLSVGRLDPEKNPLLLAEVLDRLRTADGRWQLTVAGTGPLADALARLAPDIVIAGHVAQGPALRSLYRRSHAFLHVSLTEGVPQVLYEAMAAGLPIVATDVGGVRAALEHGALGLLVPPRRADLAAAAVERLAAEPALRERLITSGIAHVAHHTIDFELNRVSAFLRDAAGTRFPN